MNIKPLKRKINNYYVYIIEAGDGTLYTGYTNNLENRIKLHNSGHGAKYLRGRLPLKLVYKNKYRYFKSAISEEIRIKKLKKLHKIQLIKSYEKHK